MDEVLMVPAVNLPANAARLNVTYNGTNGFLPDPVPYDATDGDLKQMAVEAMANGDIPGIEAVQANLADFVVDRFGPTDEITYARLFIRPKTPLGRSRDDIVRGLVRYSFADISGFAGLTPREQAIVGDEQSIQDLLAWATQD